MGIGKRIKEARENLGLTQKELGDLLGVTGSAVTNYENETSHPKELIMYKLFEVLHVDANFLFQDEMKKSPAQESETDERKQKLIKNYDAMNDEGKEALTNMSDDMVAGGRYKSEDDLVTYRLVARNNFQNVHEIKGKRFDVTKVKGLNEDDDF